MAISSRQVQNKRDGNGVLPGKPGTVYDVNIKYNLPEGKQTVGEYLEEWVENHGKANLRPSTFAGYKSHIKNHIVPYIGHVQLNQLPSRHA